NPTARPARTAVASGLAVATFQRAAPEAAGGLAGSPVQAIVAWSADATAGVQQQAFHLHRLQARPGLRCKPASLASSIEVSPAAAGLDLLFAPLSDYAAAALPPICAA
ncbi:hypothetical protein KQ767_15845, partial [Listeria monocytogenes]|nr:hypothetical protein [Listeria monocytogenes]